MNYRSTADLNADVKDWILDLPRDIDLVVGIPRSGLLPANLLALHLNIPLTDLEGLQEGRLLQTGNRYESLPNFNDIRHVLVVDDSVRSGSQMREAKSQLSSREFPFDITYGAVYASSNGKQYVDTYRQVVGTPRVFEWNIMHHDGVLPDACVDLDGVLCRDPTPDENDDGENYREFISTVKPRTIPSEKIGWIVTCRLEKYRDLTEAWLEEHGITYGKLVMMDYPDRETRIQRANHANYKANIYTTTESRLFIESNHSQAEKIARLTKKPVFSVENNQMLRQDYLTRLHRKSQSNIDRIYSDPIGFPKKAIRYLYSRIR